MFARPLFALALMASSVLAATHTVNVAPNKSLTFEPAEVKAELGDVIEFKFLAGNHIVTQSTFAAPCTNAGFNSGQIPGNPDSPISYSILVNDTKPMWVYCATGQHCQNGMVMAVNAPAEGNTFAAFQANAAGGGNATAAGNSTGSASPSSPAGSASASPGVSGSASASSTAADSSASASASSTNGTSPSSASTDSSASSLDINFVPISLITLLALWFTLA